MLVNIESGKEPNEREWELLQIRADEILHSPYSSPEQVEWALNIIVDALLLPFDQQHERPSRKHHAAR